MKNLIKKTVLVLLVSSLAISCSKQEDEIIDIDYLERKKDKCKNKETLNIPFQSSSFFYEVKRCNKKVTIQGTIVEPLSLFPVNVKLDINNMSNRVTIENKTNERLSITVFCYGELIDFITVDQNYKAVIKKSNRKGLKVKLTQN